MSGVHILSCYIPPKDPTFICSTCPGDYYDQLGRCIQNYEHTNLIIVGDLNARTGNLPDCQIVVDGKGRPREASIQCNEINICGTACQTRKSMDKTVNEYGKELLNLCMNTNNYICIVNGRMQGDSNGMYAKVHMTGKSVVDYTLVARDKVALIQNFYVGQHMPESDHRPLICKVNLQIESGEERYDADVMIKDYEGRAYYKCKEQDKEVFERKLTDDIGSAFRITSRKR